MTDETKHSVVEHIEMAADYQNQMIGFPVELWEEVKEALAAQPRDDVRKASTYERLSQMLRREKLKPTARFLEAAYLGYNLCRMERDGRIARHEGSGTGSAI